MKFIKFIVPYVIVSPAAVAVFFIAMFLCCVSVESVLHGILYITGLFSVFMTKHAQDITVISLAGPIALGIAGFFMNRAVHEFNAMFASHHTA